MSPREYTVRRGHEGFQILDPQGLMLCDGMGSREVDILLPIVNAHGDLVAALENETTFLDDLANILDGWAKQSENSGWSTHQVESNRREANRIRRRRALLHAEISKLTKKS